GSLVLGGIGGEFKNGNYKLVVEIIIIEVDIMSLAGILKSGQLLIFDRDQVPKPYSFLILEKLESTPDLNSKAAYRAILSNEYWRLISDSLSISTGLTYHFIDTNQVLINNNRIYNGIVDNWNLSVNPGKYRLETYQNQVFLYVIDEIRLEQYFYSVKRKIDGAYLVDSFEQGWYREPPTKHRVLLKKEVLPSKRDIKKLEKSLLGKWHSIGTAFPFYPELSGYDSIHSEYLTLDFSKSTFLIEYGANLIGKDTSLYKVNRLNGEWELGRTGKYVFLETDEGYHRYMTIKNVTDSSAIVSVSLWAIDEVFIEWQRSIELIKN
ncbi:MAG: hypothetical protein RIC80_04805, partial [Cyclobacteriaceae bacterium]